MGTPAKIVIIIFKTKHLLTGPVGNTYNEFIRIVYRSLMVQFLYLISTKMIIKSDKEISSYKIIYIYNIDGGVIKCTHLMQFKCHQSFTTGG